MNRRTKPRDKSKNAGAKQIAQLKREIREWQKAVADMIELVPQPTRSVLCAKIATSPHVWKSLPGRDRLQASLILRANGLT